MKNTLLLILLVLSIGVYSRNKIIQDSTFKQNRDSHKISKISVLDSNKTNTQTTIKPSQSEKPESDSDLMEQYRRLKLRTKFYGQNLKKISTQSVRPMQSYGSYEFDPISTNYERFKNSPCFEKLGFNALRAKNDSLNFELEYQNCERDHENNQRKKIFLIVLFMTFLSGIIVFLYKKIKNNNQTKK